MYFCLPNISNSTHIEQLKEMIPPASQNTVALCNHITLPMHYYISSKLLTLCKVTDVPIQTSDILVLTVCVHFINLSLR